MRFEQHYSSSRRNFYTVTASNGKRLLIECGARWTDLQKALSYDLSGIVGCLLTHEHRDHSKAVEAVMVAGIDVFASNGTFDAISVGRNRRAKRIINQTLIKFAGDFGVLVFSTNHDAAEPMGFIVHEIASKEYLLFATDTSHITQRFKVPFTIVAIECAYDKDVLQECVDTHDINETLAKRLLTSHMEKQVAMRYLAEFCDLSKCREIHLLHMSADNIDREQAKTDFEKRFFIETMIAANIRARGQGCQDSKAN